MNPVVHFELPAEDTKRMAAFYTNAFGWQTQQLGPEMNNYVVVTTTDTDAAGRPTVPGTINGGFYPKQASALPPQPSVVIAVTDIKAAILKIKEAGGTVLGEPIMVPGIGLYANFLDTEGNRSSILQPMDMG
jgi:predicted enzyme related to lactoylglutathione lyase